MEGDNNMNEKNKRDKQKDNAKSSGDVKIFLYKSKKYSKAKNFIERLGPHEARHNLNTVEYNFRQKYKPYHDREYVHYHRDYEAYNYRGYDIKEPKVKICPAIADPKEQPMQWIQYLSHAERHPRLPPRMCYIPNDNTFIQISLMMLLLVLATTLGMSLVGLYSMTVQDMFLEPYDYSWIPAAFGVTITLYMVLCTACARVFPFSLILLLINLASMCWMCMYVTAVHETHGIVLALVCIMFIVLILIIFALCDLDFRRSKFLLISGVLSFLFCYIMLWIIADNFEEWAPPLPRRANLLIFGCMVYCVLRKFRLIWYTSFCPRLHSRRYKNDSIYYIIYFVSMVLVLQLIISDRTLKLTDEDYTLGTFMLYMCIPCLFMKLVSHLGLFVENRFKSF